MMSKTHACPRRFASPVLAMLLLGALCAPAWALDLADGRIKLTLHERIGRFSLSCQTRGKDGIYVPLLASQDPRTTSVSVVAGNKIYRMGESSEFSEAVEKTPTGGRFIWRSAFLQVTETFTWLASQDSPVTDGVRVDIALKNLSQADITAGVRFLFDTYLGESSFVHFRTDTLTQVSRELTLQAGSRPAYWVSPLAGDPEDFGFQVITSGQGITVPDKIVFANWKRLSDAPWVFDTSPSRNFSLLPYSVNDSAASQYYDPRPIPRGGEVTITLAIQKFSMAGFGVSSSTLAPSLAAGQKATGDRRVVTADLATVNRILAQVDAGVTSGTIISDEDLVQIESTLKDLEGRAVRIAPATGK
jgi:hypothetical protein